ncbi:MAG: hypothetical protein U5N56_08125 [Candidatus Marinimicrobia bacterium]|nr:hypothetical protein [Candidatus Neomarinimicrobiota bacterium]
MIYFYKIINSGLPELDNKIMGVTQNPPEGGLINFKYLSGPSMWAVFEPKPIKEHSYDLFWKTLAEGDEHFVDCDIRTFNRKLREDTFSTVSILQTFEVNKKNFIIFDFNYDYRLVMMVGSFQLPDRGTITGGKDGYFWIEDFYEKRTQKRHYKKLFGLTENEATEFMKKYKK